MGGQSLARLWPLFAGILVVSVGVVGGVAGAPPVVVDHDRPTGVYGVQLDPDNVLLHVKLRANGTGLWRVEYRIRLDDENSTEAFERHRQTIEENPDAYADRFARDMRATIATAENATGREMSLSNVTVSATRERLPQRYGIITYTFQWHGFATTNTSAIRVGDALRGMFLDGETTFIVTWPARYNRVVVDPAATTTRENGVVWEGALHFAADQPRVVVSETADPGTQATTGEDGSPDRLDGAPVGGASVWVGIGAVFVLVGVGLVGARYFDHLPGILGGDAGGGGVDQALMSNEEQVRTVLEDQGGRMRQQVLADRLDWTDAKTSKVIRGMREEGVIETFRIGRENVVTLPDVDPDESDT